MSTNGRHETPKERAQREVEEEIRAGVEEQLIGSVSREDAMAQVPDMLRSQIADRVGCDVEEVELINARWTGENGDVFECDGFRVVKRD